MTIAVSVLRLSMRLNPRRRICPRCIAFRAFYMTSCARPCGLRTLIASVRIMRQIYRAPEQIAGFPELTLLCSVPVGRGVVS